MRNGGPKTQKQESSCEKLLGDEELAGGKAKVTEELSLLINEVPWEEIRKRGINARQTAAKFFCVLAHIVKCLGFWHAVVTVCMIIQTFKIKRILKNVSHEM